MDLRTQLGEDLKQAMRNRDTVAMETIRGVRAAMLNREVEVGGEIDDGEILKLIRGLVKQRIDSIEQYRAGNRSDLVEREQQEQRILEGYLPAAPDEATIDRTVQETIAAMGASSMKDMGPVMKACQAALGPAVDGKALSAKVRAALS